MHEFSSKREMLTYRYGEIETPFLKRDQREDRVLGIYVKQMHFWKMICFLGLIISFLLLSAFMFTVHSPRAHVLVAEVLPNGFTNQVGWLKTTS